MQEAVIKTPNDYRFTVNKLIWSIDATQKRTRIS